MPAYKGRNRDDRETVSRNRPLDRPAGAGHSERCRSGVADITQRRKDTPSERAARGKQARKRAPRSSHAAWEAAPDRPDPVDLLEEQAADRVQELVPIRYGRMLTSPAAFYRGGALVMASDLANTPVSGLNAQLCGDAHLMNFGLFESPERRLVFDINDFDETLPGPFEWDVKRLAASFEVAGRDRGFDAPTRRAIVLSCVRSYREAMFSHGRDACHRRLVYAPRRRPHPGQSQGHGRGECAPGPRRTSPVRRDKDSLRAFSRLIEHRRRAAAVQE